MCRESNKKSRAQPLLPAACPRWQQRTAPSPLKRNVTRHAPTSNDRVRASAPSPSPPAPHPSPRAPCREARLSPTARAS
eukprot:scaffold212128_cov32-Tisochrysis_lutea.AAC.1